MSIGCLMAMPSAKGLFQKGILESGVGSTAGPVGPADKTGELFLQIAGIKKDDVKALRALTPKQLLEIEMKMQAKLAGPGEAAKITVTAPVIDGEIIPDIPNELAKQGFSKDVITIVGTNLDEWKLFAIMQPGSDKMNEAQLLERLAIYLNPDDARTLVAAYRQARERKGEPTSPPAILSAVFTDLMFRIPALELVEAQQANNQKAYNYLFTWKSPVLGGALGACHALEIGFVFNSYDAMFCGTGSDADKLAGCMQDAWIAFARTGDPSCECTGKWPVYGKERMTMVFDKNTRVESALYEEERKAWHNVKRLTAMP
jgi:para-nitrobenzyl esterase